MADTAQLETMRTAAFSALVGAMESLLFDRLDTVAAQAFTATALQEIGAMLAHTTSACSPDAGVTHHG